MAERRLGTGLGALFGDAAIDPLASDFVYLPISKIEPRKDQPRQTFDEESLSELAASIREHGVLQPLTVRSTGGGYYQIIAGERRWRAARIAGLTELPARIVTADDRKASELALVENLQRQDLNPVEEARGYKTLMTEYGMTQEEVAQRVGKSRPAVANALRLLSLPENLLSMLERGQLSAGLARTLLSLDDEDQIQAAAGEIVRSKMSVREAEKLVRRLKKPGGQGQKKPPAANDGRMFFAELEDRLSRFMGRRVRIVSGKNKGLIEIEYYGLEDLETLANFLLSSGGQGDSGK